jgi:hypothetical protein
MTGKPESLDKAVHHVLRAWYGGGFELSPWIDLWLVASRLGGAGIGADGPEASAAFDYAVRQVVLGGLDLLAEQGAGDAADLLRQRFLDDMPVHVVANRHNVSENVVYHRQREAIRALAGAIWQAERARVTERVERIEARLEFYEPPRLFGVRAKLGHLVEILLRGEMPWLVALHGLGGIGKTSLADAAVRAVAQRPAFVDIAWVSARQDRFTLWGGLLQAPAEKPALTIESLVEAIVEQLRFGELASLSSAQKRAGLAARLKAGRYLVVVDNLETAADYRALVPDLMSLINPSKVLLTSRRSLHEYERVHSLTLDELSAEDSLSLVRHEAHERGLADVAEAADPALLRVYDVTGGNPLALKLVVGQMHTLSLPQVVDDLREARGETVEGLYRHIYWRAWNLLSEAAQRVLAIMPLVAETGSTLEQLAALSGVGSDQASAALGQLVRLSLVSVRGTLEARRYSIHRLTETFLLNEVVKWQSPT